jgi:hypothetical protein
MEGLAKAQRNYDAMSPSEDVLDALHADPIPELTAAQSKGAIRCFEEDYFRTVSENPGRIVIVVSRRIL